MKTSLSGLLRDIKESEYYEENDSIIFIVGMCLVRLFGTIQESKRKKPLYF